MSGLRETIRRRGGLELTSRVVGGLWVVGERTQTSPYNAAATAALKAQFPTQWPTIRDYGYAHPEIVGYMNAYATEDAKIAYSLVEGIGWRFLTPATNQSYFITNMVYGSGDVEVEAQMKITGLANFDCPFSGLNDRYYLCSVYKGYIITCAKSGTWGTGVWAYDTISENTPYTALSIIKSNGQYSLKKDSNAESVKTGGHAATSPNAKIALFEYTNGSGTIQGPNNMGMYGGRVRIKASGVEHLFAPFIRNGQNEMLDLTTGNICTRAGSFTISESPS